MDSTESLSLYWDGTADGIRQIEKETGVHFKVTGGNPLRSYQGGREVRSTPVHIEPQGRPHPGRSGAGDLTFERKPGGAWKFIR